MSTSPNHRNDSMPDWYDPFSEPNTIPSGWDVSDLTSKNTNAPTGKEKAHEREAVETLHRVDLSLN